MKDNDLLKKVINENSRYGSYEQEQIEGFDAPKL